MSKAIDPDYVWRARIKNGERFYYHPQKHAEHLQSMEGQEIEEIVRPAIEPVTSDQHGYLRGGIIRMTCMKTEMFGGWTESDIYDYFADKYFTIPKTKTLNGKLVQFRERLSMSSCGKQRAAEFIQNILTELAHHNIFPPEPSEVVLNKYSSKDR